MKRVLVSAALAVVTGLVGMPHAEAVCYNDGGGCVYASGGYWCWWERGANGNTREVCIGATGMRWCTTDFGTTTCQYTP